MYQKASFNLTGLNLIRLIWKLEPVRLFKIEKFDPTRNTTFFPITLSDLLISINIIRLIWECNADLSKFQFKIRISVIIMTVIIVTNTEILWLQIQWRPFVTFCWEFSYVLSNTKALGLFKEPPNIFNLPYQLQRACFTLKLQNRKSRPLRDRFQMALLI